MKTKNLLLTLALITIVMVTKSQEIENQKKPFTTNLLFGLNQPLLGGFNIEGNVASKKIIFDYSHGVSLNFNNEILDETNKSQNLAVHVPWTTGFGIGYRFNNWLNLRAEPKWHKFELYYDGETQIQQNQIEEYTTFSMGLGLYANVKPFKNQDNFLSGFMIAPSIRWWPRVSSSLTDNSFNYYNKTLDQNFTHEALEVGVNNTPLILNMSIGYSIDWNLNK